MARNAWLAWQMHPREARARRRGSGRTAEGHRRVRSAKTIRTSFAEAAWQRAQLEAVSSRPMAARGYGVAQCYPPLPNVRAEGPEPGWRLAREAQHRPAALRGPSGMPVEVPLE